MARPDPPSVTDIFMRAVELPRSDRPAFIERACDGDRQLADEVTSLIAHDSPDTITDRLPAPQRTAPGRLLGKRSSALEATKWRRQRRWLAGIGAALALVVAAAGTLGYQRLRADIRADAETRLRTTLGAGVNAVSTLLADRRALVERWATEPQVREALIELAIATRGRDVPAAEVRAMPANTRLYEALAPFLREPGVMGVNAVSREGLIISWGPSPGDQAVQGAFRLSASGGELLAPGFLGETIVTPPFAGRSLVASANISDSPPTPTSGRPAPMRIVIGVPVRDNSGDILALFGARFAAEPHISDRLEAGSDASHETFLIDEEAALLSRSRHLDRLAGLLLAQQEGGTAPAGWLRLRDPGGDLAKGHELAGPWDTLPLTRMAASATQGHSGLDLDGYRNVSGRLVVGAWTWLPQYRMSVATEFDYAATYSVLSAVQWLLGVLVAGLGGLATVALLSTVSTSRLRAEIVRVRRLGQYRLGDQIGEGGMAKVYRARHAVMKRPVAIKLIDPNIAGPDSTARFEREVAMIARLTHPNTVRIYDFGETRDGALFYVMELVPGITLSELVREDGPQPPGRVIAITAQVAAALAEAHGLGIVHRDIKPANLMIGSRTDEADVVKVLDFGLARTMAGDVSQITQRHLLGGTPAYIAPERIATPDQIDPRSDIFSLGAVMYYLGVGTDLVHGESTEEILLSASRDDLGASVAAASKEQLPEKMAALITRCVSREPDDRPQDARELRDELAGLSRQYRWTQQQAAEWWDRREDRAPGRPA